MIHFDVISMLWSSNNINLHQSELKINISMALDENWCAQKKKKKHIFVSINRVLSSRYQIEQHI